MGIWILLAVPVLAAGAGCRRLLMLRGRAQDAWRELEAQLYERQTRTLELLEAVGETPAGESEALSDLQSACRKARDSQGIPAQAEAENELAQSLCRFLSYVGIGDRSDERIRALSEELVVMRDRTSLAAQSYNQRVMAWNQALHRLPWSLVAGVARFEPIEYFVLDDPDARRKIANGGLTEAAGDRLRPEHPNA
jgi:LemA protein